MAKVSKRIENSYEAYLKYRESWKKKGYGLDRELSLEEYSRAHKDASHAGWNHIAREVAQLDRTYSRSEASNIVRRLKSAEYFDDVDKEEISKLRKKYKRAKDIYGIQLSPEEAAASEQRRRERLAERGIEPKYVIQANARAKLFNELRDAGLSYKEAAWLIDSE